MATTTAPLSPDAYARAFVARAASECAPDALPRSPLGSGGSEPAVLALQKRVSRLRPYLEQLSAFFAERRAAESAYAAALAKIARRYPSLADPALAPPSFVPLASRLGFDLAETAAAHAAFDRDLAQQCEAPVRAALPAPSALKATDESVSSARKAVAQADVSAARDQRKADSAAQDAPGTRAATSAHAKAQQSHAAAAEARAAYADSVRHAAGTYQKIDFAALSAMQQAAGAYQAAATAVAKHLRTISLATQDELSKFSPDADMRAFLAQQVPQQSSHQADAIVSSPSYGAHTQTPGGPFENPGSTTSPFSLGDESSPRYPPRSGVNRSLSSHSRGEINRTGSRRRNQNGDLNRSNSGAGVKRVDSVSRGTDRHKYGASPVSIKLADQPLRPLSPSANSQASPFSSDSPQPLQLTDAPVPSQAQAQAQPQTHPQAQAQAQTQTQTQLQAQAQAQGKAPGPDALRGPAPAPQPIAVPVPEDVFSYGHHTRGQSVPTPQEANAHANAPAHTHAQARAHVRAASRPASPTSSPFEAEGGVPLTRTRSNSSLRDLVSAGNPLKTALSRFGKGKQGGRPPPSTSTGLADAAAHGSPKEDAPQLKRSTTLGSIMGRRRGKRSESPGSRHTPPRPEDPALWDDTLRQIYRTQGTGPIETHNLIYGYAHKGQGQGQGQGKGQVQGVTPAQAVALAAREKDSTSLISDEEDEVVRKRGAPRAALPPPQPVFSEAGKKTQSKSPAVLRWRSQHAKDPAAPEAGLASDRSGSAFACALPDKPTSKEPPSSPPLGSDEEPDPRLPADDSREYVLPPLPMTGSGMGTEASTEDLLAALGNLPSPPPPRVRTPGSFTGSRAGSRGGSRAGSPGPSLALTAPKSGRALPSLPTASGATLHPTISETVNVLLAGQTVQRIMVTGEVRLASKEAIVPGLGEQRFIPLRLEGLERLERGASNPAFLTRATTSPQGEAAYLLDTLALRQAQDQGAPLALFKYEVALGEARQCVPLDVHVHWKSEEGKLSMLLTYAPNPSCFLPPSATLQGLEFAAPIAGAVSNALSKPTGMWDGTTSTIRWQMPTLSLSGPPAGSPAGSAPSAGGEERILARFETTGTVQPQPVAVRWAVPGHTFSPIRLVGEGLLPEQRMTLAGKYLVTGDPFFSA